MGGVKKGVLSIILIISILLAEENFPLDLNR